jgi:hypothetical protein
MAHLAARGRPAAVATLAAGDSIVAPIATMALALVGQVAAEHLGEPGGPISPGVERDLPVDQAFSRQFFEALAQGPQNPAAEDSVTDTASVIVEP